MGTYPVNTVYLRLESIKVTGMITLHKGRRLTIEANRGALDMQIGYQLQRLPFRYQRNLRRVSLH